MSSDDLTASTGAAPRTPDPTPESIGPFRILQQIGEGGFGVVYEAERTKTVLRHVALKIIRQGWTRKTVIARFETEEEALAVMDHPYIAKVCGAGATDRGLLYWVTKLVKGEPITTADRTRLSISDRINLMIRVCDAVQHAHTRGVVHRDIKSLLLMMPKATRHRR